MIALLYDWLAPRDLAPFADKYKPATTTFKRTETEHRQQTTRTREIPAQMT